jgi:hypothetical protein
MIKMTADMSDASMANRERIKAEARAMLAKIAREPVDDFERRLIKEVTRQSVNPSPTWISNQTGEVVVGW